MKTMAQRVGMLQQLSVDTPTSSATVIGNRADVVCHDLRDFLSRNHVGFRWIDLDAHDCLQDLVELNLLKPEQVGSTITPKMLGVSDAAARRADGRTQVGGAIVSRACERLGPSDRTDCEQTYDVVVVGSGPAGLAAAVYGASEGLHTLAVERIACGGQAGTSSRIENYLGFPAGLSGDELSTRARQQALRFGAELLVARSVVSIDAGDPISGESSVHTIELEDGTRGSHEGRRPCHGRAVASSRHTGRRSSHRARCVLRRRRDRSAESARMQRTLGGRRKLRRARRRCCSRAMPTR